MSFGKMNTLIDLVKKEVSVDAEGFKSEKEVTQASVRAYREGRHGSERWANMAAFWEATALFLCGRREGPGDVSGGHG